MQSIPEWLGISIIIAPLALYIIIVLIIHFILTKQKVKLSDLLAETEVVVHQQKIEQEQKESHTETAYNDKTPSSKRSASRLILFLSGIMALSLGACITSFYFYIHIYCIDCAMDMDLSDFTNVLLALGIGVVPYAFNQIKKIRL